MAQLIELFGFLSVLLRATTLAFQSLTVGGILFSLYVHPLSSDHNPSQELILKSCRRRIRWFALALALAQMLSVTASSAVLMATAELPMVDVLGANFFLAGAAVIGVALGIAVLAGGPSRNRWSLLLSLSIVLIGASVMLSHAASRVQDRWVLGVATALHQLATAAWVGGMPYLLMVLRRSAELDILQRISQRFSNLAKTSVAILFLAGLTLSLFYIDSLNAVYGTAYGVMVASKTFLFCELLLLGALNFYLVRGIKFDPARLLTRLRCFAEAEVSIGFTVILAAASLTSVPPAADLKVGRVTGAEIVERMTPRWPRLRSPRVEELSEPTLQKLRNAAERGDLLPDSYVLGGAATNPNTPADIAWSEYNHHWSGLVVLAIGLLALAWRTGYAPWARHWPLLFLGLAAFLFLRADPENWPLGPNGFFESFANSEVLQHRAFVVLIVAFALFEWGVRTGRIRSQRAALVFPMVCSLSGALLLTHSHALQNVKEELLAELTHVPLALLGITAGWARWLEIRLPPADRKIPSWIWPVCFALIGLLLMLYRES
jgi:putative copper resistance protein D